MRHVILGTAGHIDHGKSSLVKALTGTDPDRLKEEKERGITIDIGFADLLFPESDLAVGIVDVPGHERLIRNMLAGAGGIDLVLLVIAADEGIMPQSREHLSICNLLKIRAGLVAVTKSDLVDKEWLGLVSDEIRDFVRGTFLEGAPVIPVSSRTGENLDLLKSAILERGLSIMPKSSSGFFRMPIDRVFTLKGFGTVITGTAISGSIAVDEQVEIVPAGLVSKVRGLHSHGHSIGAAYAGQRVAINLQGIEKEDISRGDVAVTPKGFSATRIIDAFLEMLPDAPSLKNRGLVHFYTGTSEVVARVVFYDTSELKGGESGFCQLRLSAPVVAAVGDRYIIRRFSPLETMGGGEILDTSPARKTRAASLANLSALRSGTVDEKINLKIEAAGKVGTTLRFLYGWINAERDVIDAAVDRLKKSGEIFFYEDMLLHRTTLSFLSEKLKEVLSRYHQQNQLKPGMLKEEVRNHLHLDARLFSYLLNSSNSVITEQNILRLKEFRIALSSSEEETTTKILTILNNAGFQPPTKDELAEVLKINVKRLTDILSVLSKKGLVIRVNEMFYISDTVYQKMLEMLRGFYSKKQEMTVAEFRDLLQTSRKYALPFLEFLDSQKATLRTGDVRRSLLK